MLPWSQSFFLFFFAKEIKSKPRSGNNESQKWREERENSLVTFASNLTFMQMTGSGSDPRALIGSIFFQTRKPIWLARLIVTTEGTVRIFTPHFASLYQGRKLFVCCTRNNICTRPRHVRHAIFRGFDMDVVPERILEEILTLVLDERFLSLTEQQKKALFAALSQRMCSPFYQPDMESI